MSQTGGYVRTEKQLEDGREGGQGPTRTVEPWSSSSRRPAVFLVQGYILSLVVNVYVLEPWLVNAFNYCYILRKVVGEYIKEPEWCANKR